MEKIINLVNYLKKQSHLEESRYLNKIANQINESLDPKPFEIRLPRQINVLEGMSSDATESCQLVNFGLKVLQRPSIMKRLQQETPFFKEDVNLVHFDLMKLIKCIEINEKSEKELKELLYSLNDRGMSQAKNISKNEFIALFNRFKNIQEAFKAKLSDDKMNYILIGTSDTTRNFIGSERGAQLFHQNSINHVLHDLGHASYDVVATRKETDDVGRRKFKPITIVADYLVEILTKFNDYVEMHSGSKAPIDLDKINKKRGTNTPLILSGSIAEIVSIMRSQKKYYDLRYLVGTHQGKAKMFTDKSDYDQDLFAYIMLSKTDAVSEIFKNPTIPPKMDLVFKKLNNDELREDFIRFIQEKHKEMIELIQMDLDKVTSEHGGYVTYLAKDQARAAERSGEEASPLNNVFVFNMLANNLLNVEKSISDRMKEKGYSERRQYGETYVGDKKTSPALAMNSFIDVAVISDIVEGQKKQMSGKLLIMPPRSKDAVEKYLKRLKSFGDYIVLKDGDRFLVPSKWLSEFKKLGDPSGSRIKMIEVEKTRFDIDKKFEDSETYFVTIRFKKSNNFWQDNYVSFALFYSDFDQSKLKTTITPLDPEKDVEEYDDKSVERDYFAKEEDPFIF